MNERARRPLRLPPALVATGLLAALVVVPSHDARSATRLPVIREDFESSQVGPWNPPSGVLTRGQLYIEAPEVAGGTRTKALATRGLLKGERFVLAPVVNGDLTYDVDIQRLAQVLDTNLMWHVNVDPKTGAQRYYQASIGYGHKGLDRTVCRIQLIEEDPTLPRGFTALTLGEADGPIIKRDEWHHVQVKVDHLGDDVHILSIDGAEVLRVEDHRLRKGRIGGRVGGDMSHWDNIEVTDDP
ncbi:MAG: hypothetical protein IPK07_08230 [Deltaproteobacteria bacterium]|nr:hypothetical protein [Deltaproteobacteria bacterium]